MFRSVPFQSDAQLKAIHKIRSDPVQIEKRSVPIRSLKETGLQNLVRSDPWKGLYQIWYRIWYQIWYQIRYQIWYKPFQGSDRTRF